jgi:dihydrofolate reductase
MTILIAACDRKYGIGKDNCIPWKTDLGFFKELTTGNIVIMGRKTWESLPKKPLPDRINIVVSNQLPHGRWFRDEDLEEKHPFWVVPNLFNALKIAESKHSDLVPFIIGGEQLYKTALEGKLVKSILLTKYGLDAECDRFFPAKSNELEKMFKRWKTIAYDNDGEIPWMRTLYTNEDKEL